MNVFEISVTPLIEINILSPGPTRYSSGFTIPSVAILEAGAELIWLKVS